MSNGRFFSQTLVSGNLTDLQVANSNKSTEKVMKFESLSEYYEYIESDNSLLVDYNTSNALTRLGDKIEDAELKKHCSYEQYFNDYSFINGGTQPKFSSADGSGYPNFSLFEDDLIYIKQRAENTINPKYKAKYNHLLWNSKHKHYFYSKLAIDNYLQFLSGVTLKLDDNLSHHSFESYFQNLFILAQSLNYKKDEALQFFVSLLGRGKINGYKEYSLMTFIVENCKKIDIKILQVFYDYANKVIEKSLYPEFLGEYLELQISLCQKLGLTPKPFHNKLAEYHIAKSSDQKESFVVHDFYLKALAQYQKAGNKEKIEETTVSIENAKKNINFKSIKVEHTDEILQRFWEALIKMTDEVTDKSDSKDIYEYIMLCDRIFPKAVVLSEEIRPVMLDLVSVMTFDINKNVSGSKKRGINPYFIYIQNFSIKHIWLVFVKGIKNGKVSYETMIEFLKHNTWYGQDFTYLNADGNVEGFNWIELLSPSLFNFFIQSEIDIKQNKNNSVGYILSIDSLVIKFEGLLREFSRHIGAQTIEIKENETQERISFEKLLENEKLKALIPEDDIALFKFLFTSEGMNLRNNIAHCFYQTNNYSVGTMLLLISALLKLGNYKLSQT